METALDDMKCIQLICTKENIRALAVDKSGRFIYVLMNNSSTFSIIDTKTLDPEDRQVTCDLKSGISSQRTQMKVLGEVLLCVSSRGLISKFDLSNPSSPILIESYHLDLGSRKEITAFHVSENHKFLFLKEKHGHQIIRLDWPGLQTRTVFPNVSGIILTNSFDIHPSGRAAWGHAKSQLSVCSFNFRKRKYWHHCLKTCYDTTNIIKTASKSRRLLFSFNSFSLSLNNLNTHKRIDTEKRISEYYLVSIFHTKDPFIFGVTGWDEFCYLLKANVKLTVFKKVSLPSQIYTVAYGEETESVVLAGNEQKVYWFS